MPEEMTPAMGTSLADLSRESTAVRRKQLQPHLKFWKVAGTVLGVLIAAGTAAGVIGKAFFVSRDEYTQKRESDAVTNAQVNSTLQDLRSSMQMQQAAFERVTDGLSEVKTDLAVIKSRTRR